MHSVNHLFLPMLQAWLRRGARCYGYWNTGIVSFKQCCGLLADLVVEFIECYVGQHKQNLEKRCMRTGIVNFLCGIIRLHQTDHNFGFRKLTMKKGILHSLLRIYNFSLC